MTLDETVPAGPAEPAVEAQVLPAFAWRPVLFVMAAVVVVLAVASGLDGYFYDELYFVAAGKLHLSAGFADQGPLLPALAALLDWLAPGSSAVLRIPMLFVTAAEVLVIAATARELGGGARAQVMSAGAFALSMHVLTENHTLSTYGIDPLWWMLICWLLVRWVRLAGGRGSGRADWLLFAAALVTAVSLQTKFLVPLLWVGLVAGLAIAGPRRLLTRPLLWAGAVIALAGAVPELLWQSSHGWPQATMTSMISAEVGLFGQVLLIPNEIMLAGVVVGSVLCCYGLWQLLRAPELERYRFLGWAVVVVAVALVFAGARPYYVAGLYGPVFAAGAVVFERRGRCRAAGWQWLLSTPAYIVSALLAVAVFFGITVPGTLLHPPSNSDLPKLATATAAAYRELAPEVRGRTAVVATTYREAAALDMYGPDLGLPHSYSPHRGYWFFGAPADQDTDMIYVGADVDRFRQYFGAVAELDPIAPEPVWRLTGRTVPWQQIWPAEQEFA